MKLVKGPPIPPLSWLEEDAPDYVDGQTLFVQPTGEEASRTCGLVQPAPGKARYIGFNQGNHGRPIPTYRTPDGFRNVHTGPMQFLSADGTIQKINCASIALGSPHSHKMGAKKLKQGVDWLNRRGRWAKLGEDLALYGRFSYVEEGPNAGAIRFRGAAYPHLTIPEAMVINNTTVSCEHWPDPQYGGRLVFAGVARVRNTAYPFDVPEEYDMPIAADLGLDEDEGPAIVCFQDPDTGETVCTPETKAKCDGSCRTNDGELPTGTSGSGNLTVQETPVMAELEESDITELRSEVAQLREDVDKVLAIVIDFEISGMDPDKLSANEKLEAMALRIEELTAKLEEVHQNQQRTTVTPDGDGVESRPDTAVLV